MFGDTPGLEVYLGCESDANEQWSCRASCVVRLIQRDGKDLIKPAYICTVQGPRRIVEMISVAVSTRDGAWSTCLKKLPNRSPKHTKA